MQSHCDPLGVWCGGDKQGAEEILEGSAVDPRQWPREAHERGALEWETVALEATQGHLTF